MYFNNILETIGNTPLVKINNLTKDIPALVLAKIETTNPGNSIKDRMAVKMIEDAEKSGILKPGGTIIEGTSKHRYGFSNSCDHQRLQMYFYHH
jgi:cystathionine beta-synthase